MQQGSRGCAAPPAIRELSSSGLGRNQSPTCHPRSCPHFGHPPDVPGEGSIPTFLPCPVPPPSKPTAASCSQLCPSSPITPTPRAGAAVLRGSIAGLCSSSITATRGCFTPPLPQKLARSPSLCPLQATSQQAEGMVPAHGVTTGDNTQPFHLQPRRPRGGRHKRSSTTRSSRAWMPHSVLTGSRRTQPAWVGARRSDFALLSAAKQTLVALAAGAWTLPLPWQPKGGFGSPPGPHLSGWLPRTTANSGTGDHSSLWASRAYPGRWGPGAPGHTGCHSHPQPCSPWPQRHLQGMGVQESKELLSQDQPPNWAASLPQPSAGQNPKVWPGPAAPHLDVPVGIQEDVLQLQVSVHDPILQGKAEPGSAQGVGGREGMGRSLPFTHGR